MSQDFPDFELIIVHDDYADDSRDIFSSLFSDHRIKKNYKENGGLLSALNDVFEAERITEENAETNGSSRIVFSAALLIMFNSDGVKYDVIAANILSSALLDGHGKLLLLLLLIIAEILGKEYSIASKAFYDGGCVQYASIEKKQWR